MLVASGEEKQELVQAMEHIKRMGYARDAQILALENEGRLIQKNCKYSTMHDLIVTLNIIIAADLELRKISATMEHLSRAKDYHITLLEEKLAAKVPDKSKQITTSSEPVEPISERSVIATGQSDKEAN